MKKGYKLYLTLSLSILFGTAGVTTLANSELTEETTETELLEDETPELKVEAGMTPANPLYFLDGFVENVRLWLATSDKEAELLLKFAEERLAEIEAMDEEDQIEYADKLYQEYGTHIEAVNNFIAQKIAEDSTSSALEGLKDELIHVTDIEEVVEGVKVVSDELKTKVKEIHTKAYAISMVTELKQEEVTKLKDAGFGYGDILKLKAVADLSGKTIEELLFLDIYESSNDGEKSIDFGKLALELELVIEEEDGTIVPDVDAIKDQFKTFQKKVRETEKELREAEKADRKERVEEILEERKVIAEGFSSKLQDKLQVRLLEFYDTIDSIYQDQLDTINRLDETVLSIEKKTEVIEELLEVKNELVEEIKTLVEKGDLHPGELGKLNAQIHKKFNEVMKGTLKFTDDQIKEIITEEQLIAQAKIAFDRIAPTLKVNGVLLIQEELDLVWSEVEIDLRSEFEDEQDTDKFVEWLKDLDDEVKSIVKNLDQQDKPSKLLDYDRILQELLTTVEQQTWLDEETFNAYVSIVHANKESIFDDLPKQGEGKVRKELAEELGELLKEFIEDQELVNPRIQSIFDELLVSTAFKQSIRLDEGNFESFKTALTVSKDKIIEDIDQDASDSKIRIELLKRIMEEYKDYMKDLNNAKGNKGSNGKR